MAGKRVVIVGGVAGGAACATRLRRLDEHAQIFVFERGPDVSYANCGLFPDQVFNPYGRPCTPKTAHIPFRD